MSTLIVSVVIGGGSDSDIFARLLRYGTPHHIMCIIDEIIMCNASTDIDD